MDYLQDQYTDQYPERILRTLQRRVRQWKAVHGPEKEVIFRQKHPPGWQGISDFTHANSLEVTLAGEPFNHLLYHYRLSYSGWSYAQVILGGESFSALGENLQHALWLSGGVPQTHRTDSLSAAYKNLSNKEQEDFTQAYHHLCAHYDLEPTTNNKGQSHENGTVESAHRHLKQRLRQALLLRGSFDFASLDAYKQFLRETIDRHNRRIHKLYLEEREHLRDLPETKTTDYNQERVVVTSSSTICVRRVLYSVPSRLIGMVLKIHLYDDRLECYVGSDHVETLTRKRTHKRAKQIHYRHVITSLARKPQAFWNYIHREELFPRFAFRQAWEVLKQAHDKRMACREYVAILKEAASREEEVNSYLEACLEAGRLPQSKQIVKTPHHELPQFDTACGNLSDYDQLIGWVI